MITENFYTGEPVITGSPSTVDLDTQEAANMASFGAYTYDPNMRRQTVSPITITPGGDNYYSNIYHQNQQQYQPQISPYGNPMPTYDMYRPQGGIGMGNPVLQPGYNPYGYYQPQVQQPQIPSHYTIKGIGISGEYMPPADFEDRINKLETEYIMDSIDNEAKNNIQRENSVYSNGSFYGGMSYYGYYNPYSYMFYNNPPTQTLSKEIDSLKQEPRENRIAFDLHISKLAHNYVGDGLTDEEIKDRYTDKTIEMPQYMAEDIQEQYQFQRMANMVPVDTSIAYRNYDASVTAEHDSIIPPDSNMKETFEKMGFLWDKWEMEEEMHRRKDLSGGNNDGSYRYFIRKKAEERYREKYNVEKKIQRFENIANAFGPTNEGKQNFLNTYCPTLSQNAKLADDGTLEVSFRLPSEQEEINKQEAEYQARRERFVQFVNSVPSDPTETWVNEAKKNAIDNWKGV